jgi:hypothetical protein
MEEIIRILESEPELHVIYWKYTTEIKYHSTSECNYNFYNFYLPDTNRFSFNVKKYDLTEDYIHFLYSGVREGLYNISHPVTSENSDYASANLAINAIQFETFNHDNINILINEYRDNICGGYLYGLMKQKNEEKFIDILFKFRIRNQL